VNITWILPLAFVGLFPMLFILNDNRYRIIYSLLPLITMFWVLAEYFGVKEPPHRKMSATFTEK
jgi:ABC-type uncharacterized transport system permease subunit